MLLIRLLWYYHDRADLGSTVQEQEILSYSSIGKLSFSIDSMDWKLKATELFWRSVIVTTGQVTKISGLTLKTIKAYHTNIIGVHQVDEGLSWSFTVTKKTSNWGRQVKVNLKFLIRVLHFIFFFGIFSYLHGLISNYTFIYFIEKLPPSILVFLSNAEV